MIEQNYLTHLISVLFMIDIYHICFLYFVSISLLFLPIIFIMYLIYSWLGIITGNPGVFQGYPDPYPCKPAPAATGKGFCR